MKIILMITLFLINALLNVLSLNREKELRAEQVSTEVVVQEKSFNDKRTDARKE